MSSSAVLCAISGSVERTRCAVVYRSVKIRQIEQETKDLEKVENSEQNKKSGIGSNKTRIAKSHRQGKFVLWERESGVRAETSIKQKRDKNNDKKTC